MKKEIIRLKGRDICVHVGNSNGKAQLFCIHGGMGLASDSLIPYFDPLSKIFDLVFIDQRGHGQSGVPSDENYWLENFAKDINEVVQKMSSGKSRGIFGHSLGGMIAMQTLSQFPQLFSFSILSNTALDSDWQGYASGAVSRLDKKTVDAAARKYEENPSDSTLRDLALAYAPAYFPEAPLDFSLQEMQKFLFRDAPTKFLSKSVYPSMNLNTVASEISVPTFVVAGDKDIIVPKICQEKIVSTIRSSKLSVIQDAGHFPFITRNENFISSVSKWWEEVSHSI